MENISIYSEARNEYMKQLSTWIVPPLVEFFRNEYDRISYEEGRGAMRVFQVFCAEVPRWNQDVIEKNISTVLDNCRCDYIEELMTAVFIAHTKMLTAVRVSTKQKKLSITLPKLDHFLHRVFVECARSFWKAPFLFAESGTAVEKQKNILQAEAMCIDAVSGAVRSLLPVKNILRDYLDESDSEEEAPVVEKSKKKTVPKPVETADSESDSSSSDSETEAPLHLPSPAVPTAGPFAANGAEEDLMGEPLEDIGSTNTATATATAAAAPVVLEKLETPPDAPAPTTSNHEVKEVEGKATGIQIQKLESEPQNVKIDTEPSVHFTPYDTVFDETKPGISEIRYTEKVSVEDKPSSNWGVFDDEEGDDEGTDVPRLSFAGSGTAIGIDDIEDLEGGSKLAETLDLDIDAPLGSTADFEELL
jgi:hypothetical protein